MARPFARETFDFTQDYFDVPTALDRAEDIQILFTSSRAYDAGLQEGLPNFNGCPQDSIAKGIGIVFIRISSVVVGCVGRAGARESAHTAATWRASQRAETEATEAAPETRTEREPREPRERTERTDTGTDWRRATNATARETKARRAPELPQPERATPTRDANNRECT